MKIAPCFSMRFDGVLRVQGVEALRRRHGPPRDVWIGIGEGRNSWLSSSIRCVCGGPFRPLAHRGFPARGFRSVHYVISP